VEDGSNPYSSSIATNNDPLIIGGYFNPGFLFDGRIDQLRVFNRALSQADIQATMIEGSAPNTPPAISAVSASVTINESDIATQHGTISDAEQHSGCLFMYASIGSVVQDAPPISNIGALGQPRTWTWTLDTDDGPIESQLVTIYVNDGRGGISRKSGWTVVE
jgi:hypothetical protein